MYMTLIFAKTSTAPSSFEVEKILSGAVMNGTIDLDIILDTIKAGECVKYNAQISITMKL